MEKIHPPLLFAAESRESIRSDIILRGVIAKGKVYAVFGKYAGGRMQLTSFDKDAGPGDAALLFSDHD
jgi:hypothetical protein